MIDKKLKKALLDKLRISPQALSQRINKTKKEFPMIREDADYIIAHEEGIDLSKFLDQHTIQNVQRLISQKTKNNTITSKTKNQKKFTKGITINISGDFKGTDPLLDERVLKEAKQMATIYPLLYVLENSMRQFICLFMKKYYGDNWWETEVSNGLQRNVEDKMKGENINKWHQKRGAKPIDYLDLNDLPTLFSKIINKVSPEIIPDLEWIRQLIKEVYISRCVLCHMNPLDKDSINSVKLRFRQWQKQINAKTNLIVSS